MKLVFNKENKDIFEMVRDGRKKVETRASTVKYKNMKVGDEMVFSCDGASFQKKISKVSHFMSIDDLLQVYVPSDINPKLHTREEIVEMYHSFPGYKQKIKESGLVAIELE